MLARKKKNGLGAFVRVVAVVSLMVQSSNAQELKIRRVYKMPAIGLTYTIRTANWGDYLAVENTQPGSPTAIAGLEPGDLIARVNNIPVRSQASLSKAIAFAPPDSRFQVFDRRTRQWVQVNVRLRQNPGPGPDNGNVDDPNQPPPPGQGNDNGNGGNNGGNLPDNVAGVWRSSIGGTVQFFPGGFGQFSGSSNVPLFGNSNLTCTQRADGSIHFQYQQRNGARDQGHGVLQPAGPNRLQGYFVNRMGFRVNWTLTR